MLQTLSGSEHRTSTDVVSRLLRECGHEVLVLAAALACWKATYKRAGSTKLRIIR
jgi:hypothetical protein